MVLAVVYKWDFSLVLNYAHLWVKGLGRHARLLGGHGAGRHDHRRDLRHAAARAQRKWITLPVHFYVEVFRCTPLLVQIVWFYYALPIVLQVELPDWFAAGLGLTLYMGAFATEIFRGGIISIDKGQWQASRALGMTGGELMRHIILPQATKRMVPPFVNQSIIQLKNTSLLYVVAIPDLMYTGSIVVSDTFRPLEVYTSVAIAYFVILYPLTLWAARLEARVDQ